MKKERGSEFQHVVDLFLKGRGLKTVAAAENGMICLTDEQRLGEVIEAIEVKKIDIEPEYFGDKSPIAIELSAYSILHGIAESRKLLTHGWLRDKTRLCPRGYVVNTNETQGLMVPVSYVNQWSNGELHDKYIAFDIPSFSEHFHVTQSAEEISKTGLLGGSAVNFFVQR